MIKGDVDSKTTWLYGIKITDFCMPGQPRLDAPGALHYVMGQGIDGAKISKEGFLTRLLYQVFSISILPANSESRLDELEKAQQVVNDQVNPPPLAKVIPHFCHKRKIFLIGVFWSYFR